MIVQITMDTLPLELLCAIAGELCVEDAISFRFVSRRSAAAALSTVFRRVSVLNTSSDLQGFQKAATGDMGSCVKHLDVCHGTWPRLPDQASWTSSSSLIRCLWSKSNMQARYRAYHNYRRFDAAERERNHEDSILRLSQILQLLPAIETISISSLSQSRPLSYGSHYTALKKKIWLSPLPNATINEAIECVLHVLVDSTRVRTLVIDGKFVIDGLAGIPCLPQIQNLEISGMILAYSLNRHTLPGIMGSFPGLRQISIRSSASPFSRFISIDQMKWEDLEHAELVRLWTTESALFRFVQRHARLRTLTLERITLAKGNWLSCFSKIHELGRPVSIYVGGTLPSVASAAFRYSTRYIDAFGKSLQIVKTAE